MIKNQKINSIINRIKQEKNKIMKMTKTKKLSRQAMIALISLILMPVIVLSVFLIQRYWSRASSSGCMALNLKTIRQANSVDVVFETGCLVKASVKCSIEKDSNYSFCGQDIEESTTHKITIGTEQPLEPNQGIYIKVNTGQFFESITYAFPYSEFGFGSFDETIYYSFDSVTYGQCQGDENYDPKYDYNFDGCVNMTDLNQLLPDTK